MLVRETEPRRLEGLVGAGGGELGRLLPELQAGGVRSEAVDPRVLAAALAWDAEAIVMSNIRHFTAAGV